MIVAICLMSTSASAQCTNGLQIISSPAGYSNIGGNGGVSLTASATTLSGPGSYLTTSQGTLYRLSKSSVSNGKTFAVTSDGSGDTMVRVVGIASHSGNAVLLLTAKKVSTHGDISIQVCDKDVLSSYSQIRFEIYGIGSAFVGWSY